MLWAYQSEGVLPWLTNNVNFRGKIILNNLNGHEVEVLLVATRGDGSEAAAIQAIPALGQWVADAGEVFPDLGEGPGYRVLFFSGDDGVAGDFIIDAQGSASGSSPARADIVEPDLAAPILLFSYLPGTEGSISAAVIVNMGGEETGVVLYAFQNGVQVAQSDPIAIEAGRPFAAVTTDIFPEVTGDIFLVAEADQPLLGMSFTFNALLEPSMSNAKAIPEVPGQTP